MTQRGDVILGFNPYYDIRLSQDGTVISSYAPAAIYPQPNSLVLISVKGLVDRKTTECG